MLYLYLYILTITGLLVAFSSWIALNLPQEATATQNVSRFFAIMREVLMSSMAYTALFFVLTLVIAGAICILLLLLIYAPSDFVQNYMGSNFLSKALAEVAPYIRRSAQSPGITGVPLLDYFSLLSLFLGPACGAKCTMNKYHSQESVHLTR